MNSKYFIEIRKLIILKEEVDVKEVTSKLIQFIKNNPITFIHQIAQFIPIQSVQQIIDTLDLDFQDTQNLDNMLPSLISASKLTIAELIEKFKTKTQEKNQNTFKHQRHIVFLFLSQTTIPRKELVDFLNSISDGIILKFYSYIKKNHLTRFRFAKECIKLSNSLEKDEYPQNIFELLKNIFSKIDDQIKSKIIKKFAGHFSEILLEKIFNKMFDICFFNNFLEEIFGGEKLLKIKTIISNPINLKENKEKIDIFKKFNEYFPTIETKSLLNIFKSDDTKKDKIIDILTKRFPTIFVK